MAKDLLSDVTIRSTKPASKDVRLFDGKGLYLLIKPNDARWWRIDYSINGKRKTLSLGAYPVTTLADARKKAFELKKLVANGVDPSHERKVSKELEKNVKIEQERLLNGQPATDSFKYIAEEWYKKKMPHLADSCIKGECTVV